MRILALNCGSSTIKYRLADGDRSLAEGKSAGKPDEHPVKAVFTELESRGLLEGVEAVGHRVVHGGQRFIDPTLVDEGVLRELDKLSELAPLHNPLAVAAIREAMAAVPRVPQVATFDTAFHAQMPAPAATYAIPSEWTERYAAHRYGFHGLAHRSMLAGAAEQLGSAPTDLRLVTFQLGSGCSACAIDHGRSVETSMGLTPNEGLVMATRSGDVDPTLAEYVARVSGQSYEAVYEQLTSASGLLGIAGGAGDMRDIQTDAASGDARARLAIDVFCHRARKYAGAYLAILGGADAIVFGGGIGENAPEIRERIAGGLGVPLIVVAVDEQAIICDDVLKTLTRPQ